ncbi:MAG: potassium channel protein [Bacteroidales bacterium]|nr:potassium channel protein [Bacteroidales bacterium]MDD4217002.1 potassium channel protein [Bacteroidales bacterium]MDY0141877.1 potassium channel protein [Bacteroidales bacterium]
MSKIKLKFTNTNSNRLTIFFLLLMIIVGITGYSFIEGYKIIDAVFMTIITISTVGFREIQPLSLPGKIFTVFLIISSFGIFAYALTTLTRSLMDGVFHNYFKLKKVKKRIKKTNQHVIICGYGRNGRQAAKESKEYGFEVLIIEKESTLIEQIMEDAEFMFIQGDATQEDVQSEAGIEKAKALITTLPNDADNLFVVLSAREINPDLTIISRASDDNADKKLLRAGATNIIMSDKLGGQRMAKLVAQPNVVEFLDHVMIQEKNNVRLEEISFKNIGAKFKQKTIRELKVRNISGVNVVGVRTADGTYVLNPSADYIIYCEDKLFALGTIEQINKLSQIIKEIKD